MREAVAVLRMTGVAISVGLADSLNPSTVGPALYLGTAQRPAWRVARFTVGVFVVNLAGGIVLTVGPGRLLLGLVPHPQGTVRHVIQLVAGVLLLAAAVAVWTGRRALARRELPMRGSGGSALLAGAGIAAVELPTAVPYFAVIAAITASTSSVAREIELLVLYNVAFVAPLLAIFVALVLYGERAEPWLQKAGLRLQRRWPVVLAGLLLLVGSVLTALGVAGLAA